MYQKQNWNQTDKNVYETEEYFSKRYQKWFLFDVKIQLATLVFGWGGTNVNVSTLFYVKYM